MITSLNSTPSISTGPSFSPKISFLTEIFHRLFPSQRGFFFKVWDNGFQPSWLKAEWINAFSPQKIHNALSWVCAYDIFLTTYWIAFSSFLRLNGRPKACSRILPYVLVENLKTERKKKYSSRVIRQHSKDRKISENRRSFCHLFRARCPSVASCPQTHTSWDYLFQTKNISNCMFCLPVSVYISRKREARWCNVFGVDYSSVVFHSEALWVPQHQLAGWKEEVSQDWIGQRLKKMILLQRKTQ